MDWNWLFSSLAQSNAAIVGIFGAFIITKVLSNQMAFDARKTHITATINEARKLQEEANARYIQWYNQRMKLGEMASLGEELEKNNSLTAEEFYNERNFSRYSRRNDVIKEIALNIEAWRERRKAIQPSPLSSGVMFREMPSTDLDERFPNRNIYDKMESEVEAINMVCNKVRHHARAMGTTYELIRSNPESSRQIKIALGLVSGLFLAGVLYPLGLLPAAVGPFPGVSLGAVLPAALSFKGLLLGIGAIFFGAIILMFYRINASLTYSARMLQDVLHWQEIGSYSEYFAIHEENRRIEQEQAADRDADEAPPDHDDGAASKP